jgi:hypothetical protein
MKRLHKKGSRRSLLRQRYRKLLLIGGVAGALLVGTITEGVGVVSAAQSAQGALSSMKNQQITSVVAPNGDQTPFGIAVVPLTLGKLVQGNILVADFADAGGTLAGGTSILQVNPFTGQTTVFFSGAPVAGPVGLAINPVNDGVWVGDYGSAQDGTATNDLLITPTGTLVATFSDASTINQASFLGVWGQGFSQASGKISFYYGNAGNATTGTGGGDVWRLDPHPTGPVNGQPVNSTYAQIATGQAETPAGGNAATAAGPQGLVYDNGTGNLYETNDASNTLYAIPNAATASGPVTPQVIYSGPALSSPENVTIDPTNGDLLIVNAGNNKLVEITPTGQVVAKRNLAPGQPAGALFGLAAVTAADGSLVVYYTNGNDNTLNTLSVRSPRGL